jgi:hypothetical protein
MDITQVFLILRSIRGWAHLSGEFVEAPTSELRMPSWGASFAIGNIQISDNCKRDSLL